MNWKTELFPDLKYRSYLNHAAQSPISTRVKAGIMKMMDAFSQRGVKAWTEGLAMRERTRSKLARLMGCDSKNLGLVSNTSHGLMVVAQEYPWNKGDRIVLFKGEFPSNILPWLVAAKQHGLDVMWLSQEDLETRSSTFKRIMAKKPRLMAVSWVQYQTGHTQSLANLSSIREEYGVHICIDAIQGLGPLCIDLAGTPIDFVTGGGHKWLMGAEGVGYLYVHPDRMPEMNPVLVSWISQDDPFGFLSRGSGLVDYDKPYKQSADRVEMGTMNNIGFAGLEAALDVFFEVGPKEVEKRVLGLSDRIRNGLQDMGIEIAGQRSEAGIVCIPLAADELHRWWTELDKEGVITGTPDGHLRMSPHFYNDEADVDLFLEMVQRLK